MHTPPTFLEEAGVEHAVLHLMRLDHTVLDRSPDHSFEHSLHPLITLDGADLVIAMVRAHSPHGPQALGEPAIGYARRYAVKVLNERLNTAFSGLRVDLIDTTLDPDGRLLRLDHREGVIARL